MRQLPALVLLLCVLITPARAQETDSVQTGRTVLVSGTLLTAMLGGNLLNNTMWWKGEKSAFHFEWHNDWRYALGADKFGHFYFPAMISYPVSESFRWAGFSRRTALWLGSGTALAYQTYIEIRDGFSKEWGFSWGDFTADVLGAGYPLLQEYMPALRGVDMKISFYPSARFKNNSNKVIFDDYESTTHWISIPPTLFLPDDISRLLPSRLHLAIGHSVKNLDNPAKRDFELYISLDYNLKDIAEDSFSGKLLHLLNYYHLPAPAVRIYPGVVWYGIKF